LRHLHLNVAYIGLAHENNQREHAMPKSQSTTGTESAAAAHDDLVRIIGEIDERKALEILALRPTLAEVEQAAIWATGDGDVLAKTGHPLTDIAAEIVEILTADEEEDLPPLH
jgi:hypothetical protein